jgi:hypothetical protein
LISIVHFASSPALGAVREPRTTSGLSLPPSTELRKYIFRMAGLLIPCKTPALALNPVHPGNSLLCPPLIHDSCLSLVTPSYPCALHETLTSTPSPWHLSPAHGQCGSPEGPQRLKEVMQSHLAMVAVHTESLALPV